MRSNSSGLIAAMFFMLLVLAPIAIIKQRSAEPPRSGLSVAVLSRAEGKLYRMNLEQYLEGALAAEMPARFELEALKAQAVAARTLAVHRLKRFGGKGCQHWPGADFCDDPNETQAWISVAAMKSRWGERDFAAYYGRIRRAVRETAGLILTYQNQPIDALYHSTCGVGTADAAEVWGKDFPYLRSVDCGFDRHSNRWSNEAAFTWGDLSKRLKVPVSDLRRLKVLQRSARGRILTLSLGKIRMRGSEFRTRLGLTSNAFGWKPAPGGLLFTAIGYGHGVGLCQYGADGMAKQGWNFRRILLHYYRGVTISKIK